MASGARQAFGSRRLLVLAVIRRILLQSVVIQPPSDLLYTQWLNGHTASYVSSILKHYRMFVPRGVEL